VTIQDFIASGIQPGDMVGYKGLAICRWKTGGIAGHVCVYIGPTPGSAQAVVTADLSQGVNFYPLDDQEEIVWVRRCKVPPNLGLGMDWFATVVGKPYGWDDIYEDAGLPVDGKNAYDCSHVSAAFLRVSGAPQFDPAFNESLLTPRDFETSIMCQQVWP